MKKNILIPAFHAHDFITALSCIKQFFLPYIILRPLSSTKYFHHYRPEADLIIRGDDNAVETFLANNQVDKEVAYKDSGKIAMTF